MPSSCQQVLLGIRNSVWVWCLQMGWIPRWGSLWMAFLLVSPSFFVPAFSLGRNNSGLKFLRCVGGPITHLGAVPIYWRWSIQVLSPLCWVFQLMSSPLGPGNLSYPWLLGLSSGSPSSSPPTATYFYPFSWPSRLLSCLFLYLSPLSSPLALDPSLLLPSMIILFPLLSGFGLPSC